MSIVIEGALSARSYTAPLPGSSRTSVSVDGANLAASASSVVNLQSNRQDWSDLTYASLQAGGRPDKLAVQAWQHQSNDGISTLIDGNIKRSNSTDRIKNLGFALLDKFASTSSVSDNYQQALSRFEVSVDQEQSVKDVSQVKLDSLQFSPAQEYKLQLNTVSGKTVNVTIHANEDGLGVDIDTDQELSESERHAIGQLAQGFDTALQSISAGATSLDLSELSKFDTNQIASINLEAKLNNDIPDKAWSLKFHADVNGRQLHIGSDAGQIDVSADLTKPDIIGDAGQRDKAVKTYLAQFDKAAVDGKTDAVLSKLYKAAFSAIHHSYETSSPLSGSDTLKKPGAVNSVWGGESKALLSGLADFQANIATPSKASNPARVLEVDHFNFQINQQTTQSIIDSANKSRKQLLETSLQASYHQLPVSATGVERKLTTDKNSQTYGYVEINSKTSSLSSVSYVNGHLQELALEKTSSYEKRVRQYEFGKLVSDNFSPDSRTKKYDLLGALAKNIDDPGGKEKQQALFEQWNTSLLSADPYAAGLA